MENEFIKVKRDLQNNREAIFSSMRDTGPTRPSGPSQERWYAPTSNEYKELRLSV